ncbi:metallophosphoesterase family protein, partial [Candidatus Sumerlaeota bacterium]|nr:metallophosphoesterase family protein [Candidatus Sumerlaeota bacterium]
MSDTPYRIGVISDTHGLLRPDVFEIFRGVDLILHAGDIEGDDLLAELETIAPVQAVSGNVDFPTREGLRPMTRRIETPAGRIAMTHGHLDRAPSTRPDLMAEFFADFA